MDTLPLALDTSAHHSDERDAVTPGQGAGGNALSESAELHNSARSLIDRTVCSSRRTWDAQRSRRSFATVDVAARRLWDDGGRLVHVSGVDLGDVLHAAGDARWVVVCDGHAVPMVTSWATATPPAGWRQVAAYADDRAPCIDLENVATGHRVRVSVGEQWTGRTIGAPATGDVLRRLRAGIEDGWRNYSLGTLMATPATTGRDLMARSLPDEGEVPVMSAEWAELIRDTSTQGRMELTYPVGHEVPEMYEVDMRLAYASVLWGLPYGEPSWSRGEPDEDGWRGRWRGRCSWTVPDDWAGPGLLPVRLDGEWAWPATPGETHRGWLDGSEADLARRFGWDVHVYEHIAWAKGPDPLKRWGEKIVGYYQATLRDETAGEYDHEVGQALRHAWRAILIHGLGACHGAGQTITHTTPAEQVHLIPADAKLVGMGDGDDDDSPSVVWTEQRPAAWPEMCRPEWTSTVWARTRCRLLDAPGASWPGQGRAPRVGALHLPSGVDLVGFRLDCLYLTADPGWRDDGKPGRYRVKERYGPFTMPLGLADFDKLRRTLNQSTDAGPAAARAALAAARAKAGASS